MSVSENIKYYRKLNKMTQSELASKLGVGLTAVSAWETGRSKPLMDKVSLMANLFGVKIGDIVGNNQSKANPSYDYNYFDTAVSAGNLTASEAITASNVDTINLPNHLMGRYSGDKNIFVTRVNGSSMDNVLPDDSLIAIKYIENPFELTDRDIVVFRNGDGLAVKRFYNDVVNRRLVFKPDSTNEVFTDIVIDYDCTEDLRIYGKVVVYVISL